MAHESNLSQFLYPAPTANHDIFNLQTSNYDHQLQTNNSWRGFFSEDETLNKGSPNDSKAFVMSLYNNNQRMASQNYMQQLQPFQLRNCKYLKLCEELLSELCNPQGKMEQRRKNSGGKQQENGTALWTNPYLSSVDSLELLRRKTKLLSLLEEDSTTNISTRTNNAGGRQGKVSLTLGLQQNGELTSFAMSQPPNRESLLLSRDDNFDAQDSHFTILGEVDSLPYRNLIDADQLLHDLA